MDYSYRRVFSFLKQFLWPYKGRFFIATVLTAFASTLGLYNAYAFAQVVSFTISYKAGQPLQPLYVILILWVLALTFRYLFIFLSKYIGVYIASRAAFDAEITSIRHLSYLDIAWHEKESSGNKLKKIDRGSQSIIDMSRLWLNSVIDIIISFFGILIIISHFDKMIVVFIIGYQIIYYLVSTSTRRRAIKALRIANIKDEEITGLWYEIVANIRSIKVLGMSQKIFEHAQVIGKELLIYIKKRIFWFQVGGFIQGAWEATARISFISFIIWGIFEGRYGISFLLLFYGYFNTLTNSVSQLSSVTDDISTAKANISRLTEMLDEKINIDNDSGKVDFPNEWDALHIKDLSFTYGEQSVLSRINLDIKKGEKVGIVGLSGAGKSTLFKLLLKEYENYQGEILIGDTPLRTIKKSSYTKHIAAVLQETEVFNMSLKQNVVLANNDETDNELLFDRALDIAHVRDFLPKLKAGIETIIGEKGVKLSGGERQRLGIARAVFKTPEILFLDEATSHLDVESEQKIQDSLKKFFKDVTAVVIAHRLSTIREMDRIIVIEKGKIIESGTFDELHAQSGRFREFWDKQRK